MATKKDMLEQYAEQFHSTLDKLLQENLAEASAVEFLDKLRKEIVCRILGFGWDRWRGELNLEEFKRSTELGKRMVGRLEALTGEWLRQQTAELGTIELTSKEMGQLRNVYRREYSSKLKELVKELAWANAGAAAEVIANEGAFGELPAVLTKLED